jgi:hypothetical protein
MAREYNIEEIEFEKNEIPKEKLLTGEYLKGISPHQNIQPNAEVEEGEYLQFPDQEVTKALGNEHKGGGVKVAIPDGTKILSDHLKPTKKQIRQIEKSFNINVSESDTFAKVVEKYTKKIGLAKLTDDQEKVFSQLEKMTRNKDIPKATADVNLEYLSSKIKKIEEAKKPLESERKNFFDYVFQLQEATKKPEERADQFRFGGTFEQTAMKFGMTPQEAEAYLKKGGFFTSDRFPMFEDGGVKFNYNFRTNALQNLEREYQRSASKGAYGSLGSAEDVQKGLQELYNNFPDYVTQRMGNYISVENGKVNFKGGISLNQKQNIVGDLQQDMQRRYEANLETVLSDPDATPEQKKAAQDWFEKEAFTSNLKIEGRVSKDVEDKLKSKGITTFGELEKQTAKDKNYLTKLGVDKNEISKIQPYLVRNFDQKYGQFTTGRQTMGVDLVTPEDLKKLQEKGIRTVKQLTEADFEGLSDVSKQRITEFKRRTNLEQKKDADFFIDPITPDAEPAKDPNTPEPTDLTPKTEKEKEKTKPGEQKEVVDNIKVPPQPRGPRYFYTPDQSPLPPTALDPVALFDARTTPIDPVRIGIETQLREANEQQRFIANTLEGMPETQKAAVLANMMATSQKQINQTATQANQINAQNVASAELYNAQQKDRESLMRANNLMSYEQRTLLGKAKTEEMLRRYYDQLKKVNIDNFKNTQKLNLLDSVFPEYSLDTFGMSVNFDPDNPNKEILRDSFLKMYPLLGNG